MRQRGRRGASTVYYDESRSLWVARYDVPRPKGQPRKRRVLYAKTEQEARAKLADELATLPPRPEPGPRAKAMQAARERGNHSRREWTAYLATFERPAGMPYHIRCFYCWQPVHRSRIEADHFIPVTRGGSNALSNMVPACRPCNRGKLNATGFEWFEALYLLSAGWFE